MATGDFVAMASPDFGPRLYDATAQFQEMHGLKPSGVLTSETRGTLGTVGGGIFNSWGMEFLDHPFADAAVAVPGRTGLDSTGTSHGLALDNKRHTMSVAFAFFGDGEATLQSVFDNLTRPAPGREVAMQVLKPEFLAVAGASGATRNYSRYIPDAGRHRRLHAVVEPEPAFPNADRIAVVMANELYPRRMVGGDMFAGLPGDASPISSGRGRRLGAAPARGAGGGGAASPAAGRGGAAGGAAALRRAASASSRRRPSTRKRVQDEPRDEAAEERSARAAREAEDARRARAEADRRVAQEQIRAAHLAAAQADGRPTR